MTHACSSADHDKYLWSQNARTTSDRVVAHRSEEWVEHVYTRHKIQHRKTVIVVREAMNILKGGNGVTRGSAVEKPTEPGWTVSADGEKGLCYEALCGGIGKYNSGTGGSGYEIKPSCRYGYQNGPERLIECVRLKRGGPKGDLPLLRAWHLRPRKQVQRSGNRSIGHIRRVSYVSVVVHFMGKNRSCEGERHSRDRDGGHTS